MAREGIPSDISFLTGAALGILHLGHSAPLPLCEKHAALTLEQLRWLAGQLDITLAPPADPKDSGPQVNVLTPKGTVLS